jgi:excisionase family DNA binding protein
MGAEIDLQALAAELAPLLNGHAPAPLLDGKQAAELLNVPATWLMAEAKAKRIPHLRLGKYVRFDRDELVAWRQGRTVGPRRRVFREEA